MSNHKIFDFFVSTPKYNDDIDYKDYASLTAPLNMFFLAFLLLHSVYIIIFSFFKMNMMMLFDGVGVILYAMFVILLKYWKGSFLPCTLLTIFELFLHQIISVMFFGLKPGFHYLMIPLMFMTVFIRKKGKLYDFLRGFVIFIASTGFILITILFNDYRPVKSLPYNINLVLLIINCIISFLITALYTSKVLYSIDTKRSQLDFSVTEKSNTIQDMQNKIIISFANIIEARDGSTGKHVKRTSEYVDALVKELKRNGDFADILTERYMHDVMLSAPLHDIGKITVPDAILTKAGRLTQSEFETIKKHTINGKKIIETAMVDIEDEEFLKVAKSVALYHHECWDGSGYPFGVQGEEIPLAARIMTIADYFDALVAKRAYKAALPTSVVFDNILEQRGKKFDPVVTDAFLRIRDQIDEIAKANAD